MNAPGLVRATLLCFLLASLHGVTLAAEFHLREGEVIVGALVGKANGTVTILDATGKTRTFAERDLVRFDPAVPAAASVERKAKKARSRFLKQRRRAATKLINQLDKAKPDARAALKVEIATFEEPEVIPGLDRALRSRSAHVRDYAFGRLKTFQSPGAVVPLVNYVLSGADPAFRERAHAAALGLQRDKTRQVYEYVAAAAAPDHRVMAIQRLGSVGDPKSVPRLTQMLIYVDANIRAQLVRAKRVREVPVSLSGATNVTIDLPEVELIEVMTTAKVPVVTLKRIRGAAVASLETITGASYGEDVAAWQSWWKEYTAGEVRTPEPAGEPGPNPDPSDEGR